MSLTITNGEGKHPLRSMTYLRVQGSLLTCKQVAEHRGLPHKVLSTVVELQTEYPTSAKEGYQGLFEQAPPRCVNCWNMRSPG